MTTRATTQEPRRRGGQPRLTPTQERALCEAYAEPGASLRRIAIRWGMTHTSVANILRRHERQRRRRGDPAGSEREFCRRTGVAS